ncbi:MAG: sugar phosphate isomerase/epimerase [Planctomycetes bacterium]|nr:sugar phosphate isomerase/epimerase [Planctomycetota bacterium]
MERRDFLRSAAWAPWSARLSGRGAAAGSSAPEEESAVAGRARGSTLRSSLAAYSFRHLLGASPPQMELLDVIEFAARAGLEGVELTSYWFREQSASYVAALRRAAAVNGICVSGLPIRSDFALPDGAARQKELATVTRWIEVARDLGAHTVRVFAGNAPRDLARDEALPRVVEGLRRAAEVAARCGVVLALENHGWLTESSREVLALVRAVGSPALGVNLDTGNFARSGYAEIAALAPHAVAVQVKLEVKNDAGRDEPCDFARVARLLRSASYRGFVALEAESGEVSRDAIAAYLERLVRALRS